MRSAAVTFSAGDAITRSLTATRPAAIQASASRRDVRPARAITFAMRSASFGAGGAAGPPGGRGRNGLPLGPFGLGLGRPSAKPARARRGSRGPRGLNPSLPSLLLRVMARFTDKSGLIAEFAPLPQPSFMDLALAEARAAAAAAEVLAIRQAAAALGSERLVDCDIYVTLEPCAMCAGAISFARLRRLYYGAPDPKGGAVESGVRFFSAATCHHRPELYGGIGEGEAARLLRDFFAARR